jgi:biotin carboxylase
LPELRNSCASSSARPYAGGRCPSTSSPTAAGGRDAERRARRALREYRLEGIKTTIPLHMRLLEEDVFRSGEYHTGYLEELLSKKD